MAENKDIKERRLININDEEDVRYWSQKLGAHPEQLKEAANTVGRLITDIEKYLSDVRHSI